MLLLERLLYQHLLLLLLLHQHLLRPLLLGEEQLLRLVLAEHELLLRVGGGERLLGQQVALAADADDLAAGPLLVPAQAEDVARDLLHVEHGGLPGGRPPGGGGGAGRQDLHAVPSVPGRLVRGVGARDLDVGARRHVQDLELGLGGHQGHGRGLEAAQGEGLGRDGDEGGGGPRGSGHQERLLVYTNIIRTTGQLRQRFWNLQAKIGLISSLHS